MALKFLNKKGWHTGSLRNIENVWKAEQKHEAEQKKLEEFKKQILEEREKLEFRILQEQAGLIPKQERLEFLYDSGLAVGKSSSGVGVGSSSSDAFNHLETLPPSTSNAESSTTHAAKLQASVPGALFAEEKPQSANDTWRKLHTDPLLLIRQQEQEALAKIRNNPIKMEAIKKSLEKETKKTKKKHREKHDDKLKHARQRQDSLSDDSGGKSKMRKYHLPDGFGVERKNGTLEMDAEREDRKTEKSKRRDHYDRRKKRRHDDEVSSTDSEQDNRKKSRHHQSNASSIRKKDHDRHDYMRKKDVEQKYHRVGEPSRKDYPVIRHNKEGTPSKNSLQSSGDRGRGREDSDVTTLHPDQLLRNGDSSELGRRTGTGHNKHRAGKLSEEEKAARLREMQVDAELHDDQRWKRLKNASEADSQEASQPRTSGRNFLDAAHRSIYGTEKGGSSTIEESVRRQKYYLQGRSEADEGNAFRR